MYADRHARSSGIDPRSLGIAVGLNGAIVAALLLAQPVLKIVDHTRPLTTYPVAIEPPPPPLPPDPAPHQPTRHQTVTVPRTLVEAPVPPTPLTTTDVILPPLPPTTVDTGPAIAPTATPTPALVLIAAEVDPRYRDALQPAYPANELRAEREGVVTVRVLVGTDGRVRQVEQVSATSNAFFRATQEQALRRWRFRPATRGGVPVEGWRTMTIRFVIPR